jgi:hypothetical protein
VSFELAEEIVSNLTTFEILTTSDWSFFVCYFKCRNLHCRLIGRYNLILKRFIEEIYEKISIEDKILRCVILKEGYEGSK